jgi:hypothetical protein
VDENKIFAVSLRRRGKEEMTEEKNRGGKSRGLQGRGSNQEKKQEDSIPRNLLSDRQRN